MKLRANLFSADVGAQHRSAERRGAERRELNVMVSTITNQGGVEAMISDLSTSGLRLTTIAALEVGSMIEIELIENGRFEAEVLWSKGATYGCQFNAPIPAGIVWNALLRASFEVEVPSPSCVLEEVEIGSMNDPEQLARWNSEFLGRAALSGEELIGFRKEKQRVFAIIARPESG